MDAKYKDLVGALNDLILDFDDTYANYMLTAREDNIELTTQQGVVRVKSFTSTDDKATQQEQVNEVKQEHAKLIKEAISDYVKYLTRLTPAERQKFIDHQNLKQRQKSEDQKAVLAAERVAEQKVHLGERERVSVRTEADEKREYEDGLLDLLVVEHRRLTQDERDTLTANQRAVLLNPFYERLLRHGLINFADIANVTDAQVQILFKAEYQDLIARAVFTTKKILELSPAELRHPLFKLLVSKFISTDEEALAITATEEALLMDPFYNEVLLDKDNQVNFEDIRGITAEQYKLLKDPQIEMLVGNKVLSVKDVMGLTPEEKRIITDPFYHQQLLERKINFIDIKGIRLDEARLLLQAEAKTLIKNNKLTIKEMLTVDIIKDRFYYHLLLSGKLVFQDIAGINPEEPQVFDSRFKQLIKAKAFSIKTGLQLGLNDEDLNKLVKIPPEILQHGITNRDELNAMLKRAPLEIKSESKAGSKDSESQALAAAAVGTSASYKTTFANRDSASSAAAAPVKEASSTTTAADSKQDDSKKPNPPRLS